MKNKQELCLIYSPLSSIINLIGIPDELNRNSWYKHHFKNIEKKTKTKHNNITITTTCECCSRNLLFQQPSAALPQYLLPDHNYIHEVQAGCCLLEILTAGQSYDSCRYCATDAWLQIIHLYTDHAGRSYLFHILSHYVWEEESYLYIIMYGKLLTECSFKKKKKKSKFNF